MGINVSETGALQIVIMTFIKNFFWSGGVG